MTTSLLFVVDEGREDPNITINGVLLAGRWWPNIECWLGSLVVLQGSQTSITKKRYIVVIFPGGGGGGGGRGGVQPPFAPLYSHMILLRFNEAIQYCYLNNALPFHFWNKFVSSAYMKL